MRHKGKRPRIYRKKTQAVAQVQTNEQNNHLPDYPNYPRSKDITAQVNRETIDTGRQVSAGK